ncbi:hypothetical protein CREGCYN_16020 [Synechococcus sp. M16CYN]
MVYGAFYFKEWTGRGPKKSLSYPCFLERFTFIARLFKFINFAATAQSYYGDSADSPEEARRKSIDKD